MKGCHGPGTRTLPPYNNAYTPSYQIMPYSTSINDFNLSIGQPLFTQGNLSQEEPRNSTAVSIGFFGEAMNNILLPQTPNLNNMKIYAPDSLSMRGFIATRQAIIEDLQLVLYLRNITYDRDFYVITELWRRIYPTTQGFELNNTNPSPNNIADYAFQCISSSQKSYTITKDINVGEVVIDISGPITPSVQISYRDHIAVVIRLAVDGEPITSVISSTCSVLGGGLGLKF